MVILDNYTENLDTKTAKQQKKKSMGLTPMQLIQSIFFSGFANSVLTGIFKNLQLQYKIHDFAISKKGVCTAAARRALVVIKSKCLSFFLYVFLYVCHVTFSMPLISQKKESYTVKEVIQVDELNKGNLYAAAGKQDK